MLWETINRVRESIPVWVSVGVGAALLASLVAAMSASTLMRFTTAASIWLLVGVVVAAPVTGQRLTVADLRQRLGRFHRSAPAEPA
jgi:multisubunit Na+/H+ antiporter MnhG subunit